MSGLWKMVIVDEIDAIECTAEIQGFVDRISIEDLFQKVTWLSMPALEEVTPEDDIFPVRAQYKQGGDFKIGINYLPTSRFLTDTLQAEPQSKDRTEG
jgi:hypothetical protein